MKKKSHTSDDEYKKILLNVDNECKKILLNVDFIKNLFEKIEDKDDFYEKVAKKTNFYRILNGGDTSVSVVYKMADFFNKPISDFFHYNENKNVSNSTIVGSNVINSNGSTIHSAMPEVAMEREKNYQEVIKKLQEQIDRLLGMIEKFSTNH